MRSRYNRRPVPPSDGSWRGRLQLRFRHRSRSRSDGVPQVPARTLIRWIRARAAANGPDDRKAKTVDRAGGCATIENRLAIVVSHRKYSKLELSPHQSPSIRGDLAL